MFGGKLTIEEFRRNQNTYTMVYPPILSIIPQLEEIKMLESGETGNLVINTTKNPVTKKTGLSKLFIRK